MQIPRQKWQYYKRQGIKMSNLVTSLNLKIGLKSINVEKINAKDMALYVIRLIRDSLVV